MCVCPPECNTPTNYASCDCSLNACNLWWWRVIFKYKEWVSSDFIFFVRMSYTHISCLGCTKEPFSLTKNQIEYVNVDADAMWCIVSIFEPHMKCIMSRSLCAQSNKRGQKSNENANMSSVYTHNDSLQSITKIYVYSLFWICGRWPKLKCSLFMSFNLFLWCSFAWVWATWMSYVEEYFKRIFASGSQKICRFWNIVVFYLLLIMLQLLWILSQLTCFLWSIYYCHSFPYTVKCDKNSEARMVFQKKKIKWI